MTQVIISRKATGIVLCVLLAVLVPLGAIAMYTGSEGWVDQLTGFVVVQEGIASAKGEPGSFDPLCRPSHPGAKPL
ncbi:MAG: hypothetical protein AAB242_10995 [Nitrospirota bacterium]